MAGRCRRDEGLQQLPDESDLASVERLERDLGEPSQLRDQ
jgi:hypothetical protein